MKISLNWVKDFVDIEGIDINELWYRFTMSTAEVDEVVRKGSDIEGVVVAEVMEVKQHPSSRKLKICIVDTGGEKVQSLCGAPNIRTGIKVPFAVEGGAIRGVEKVGEMKMGGVESSGIICSPRELGISDSHEGVMVLPEDYATGRNLKEYIDIDDVIAEIDNKSLTNRPDLWGHYGIAREIAAIFGRKLKPLPVEDIKDDGELPELDIVIEDDKKCKRYCGLSIADVRGGKTPVNMQTRLYYCGMRPIEPIVDLTNYIMLEIGQPMHAFDRRQIRKLVVRPTAEPMVFHTLDDVGRKIPKDVLMINDGDAPVAIAGIMGGGNSEIQDDTSEIFLEAANFEGSSTRRSSVAIGLRTEASARFEKTLDPAMLPISIRRFVYLLKDINPDICLTSKLTDIYPAKQEPVHISINKQYIDRYVGQEITVDRVVEILESLEFGVERKGDELDVKVPTFRATKDVTIKADLVEEITRIYGYDNICPKTVKTVLKPLDYNEERLAEHRIRELLAGGFGYNEVHSYVWYDSDFNSRVGISSNGSVRIVNPQAENLSMLRESMVPSMLQAAENNARFYDNFSIFEIGSVYKAGGNAGECDENKNLCILLASSDEKEDDLFYKLKGVTDTLLKVEKKMPADYECCNLAEDRDYSWVHPVKAASVFADGKELGYVTAVHPAVSGKMETRLKLAVLEIFIPLLHSIDERGIMYEEPPRYQTTSLDFSFLVEHHVPYEKLGKDIDGFTSDILIDKRFIDIYEGKGIPEGKKSMTFRFGIGSRDRTLTSREIDDFSDRLVAYMKEKGYPLR